MRYEVTNLRLLEVVRSKSSFDVSFRGQTHLPFVTSTNDRSQEAHDFYPKNGCDVCALKRGWSRAAIQTVAGGTPFVKPRRREREIALRKRFVQKLTWSFERLSVPQIRLVEFSIQAWRKITGLECNVSILARKKRKESVPWKRDENRREKRKYASRQCQYLYTRSDNCSHIYLSFFFS